LDIEGNVIPLSGLKTKDNIKLSVEPSLGYKVVSIAKIKK
jgi:hypothetical protein